MFAISIDSDWAPQFMIDDTIKLLDEFDISATFFITNKLDFKKMSNHELAIHPNFTNLDHETILTKTLDFLPTKKSKGSRSHKLFHSSSLLDLYPKYGLEYDSNYYLPSYENISPFFLEWTDVLEIPFFFADDAHFETNSHFDLEKINVKNIGTKVFLFHPFHIFMNTKNKIEYNQFKEHYHDLSFLQSKRNLDKKGTRTLFLELLNFIKSQNIDVYTLENINNFYRNIRKEKVS